MINEEIIAVLMGLFIPISISIAVIVIIILLIVKRINDKKKEKFEQRKW